MNNLGLKMQELATVEWRIYILERICIRLNALKQEMEETQYNSVPAIKPQEPRNVYVEAYPSFDEKYYNKLVKERRLGNKATTLRWGLLEAGLVACQTIIGLPIGVILLELSLLLLPFGVTSRRKAAWRLYEEDCEEIEKRNQKAKQIWEKYERDLQLYNEANNQSGAHERQKPKKMAIVNQQQETVTWALQRMLRIRDELYDIMQIPDTFRSPVSIQMVSGYLNCKMASNLDEAIKRYCAVLEQNSITGEVEIDYVISHKNNMKIYMPVVVQKIEECEKEEVAMCEQFARLTEMCAQRSISIDLRTESAISTYANRVLNEGNKILDSWKYEVER